MSTFDISDHQNQYQYIYRGTLVNVPASPTISVELEARGTATLEGSESVVTLVLAGTRRGETLVEILTAGPGEVWLVTSVTNTAVGAEGVDTEPVVTEVRHGGALVNLLAQRTELQVLSCAPPGTGLTVLAPGHSHGAAALGPGDLRGSAHLAPPPDLPLVTQTSPGVQAAPAVLSAGVAGATLTLVTSGCVETPPGRPADLRPLLALVNVLTVVIRANLSEPVRAGAKERPDQILTVELALVCLRQTLIDVW